MSNDFNGYCSNGSSPQESYTRVRYARLETLLGNAAIAAIGYNRRLALCSQTSDNGRMSHDPRFYTSSPWRAARAAFLAAHPVCEVPGCTTRATHVDHVRSRASGGASLDPRNFAARCVSCHSRKTATADGGFGNKRGGVVSLGKQGCDAAGNPVDPGHRWAK